MLLTEMEELSKNLNALEKFLSALPEKALNLGVRVLIAAVLFFIGVKVIKFIRKITKKSLERANVEVGVVQFLDALIKILLYIVLIIMIAGNFGFDAASIVALLGSAGVTIGLALQGSLSNLAGGVLILLLKPFRVGDYIIESGHGNEGFVKEIGIFYTKLMTGDNKVVVLPNGGLANASITNASESKTRRVDLMVGISYNNDIETAKNTIREVIAEDADALQGEPVSVFVDSLGDSSVNIGIRFYCENTKYWEVRWRMLENVKTAFDNAGIEIPYPQVTVHSAGQD